MKRERIAALSIDPDCSLIEALKKMDGAESKLLMVLREGRLRGVLSIGDIQRSILARLPLETTAGTILRKDFLSCSTGDTQERIRELMLANRCEYMPIVGMDFRLEGAVAWEELFDAETPKARRRAPSRARRSTSS